MNNRSVRRKPIPWIHKSNPLVTSWVWDTPHFIVTIYAEGLSAKKMYNWKINDKSQHGEPVPFDSSGAESFNACVDAILEIIGKSYDRDLGYQEYAGSLATTFAVYDGRRLDLGDIIGETVTMVVKNDNGPDPLVFTGTFDIDHYDLLLRTGETEATLVPPSYVLDIRRQYGGNSLLEELSNKVQTSKSGTIFYEEWRKGCTGRPGYHPGTVEHSPGDPICPFHNF